MKTDELDQVIGQSVLLTHNKALTNMSVIDLNEERPIN